MVSVAKVAPYLFKKGSAESTTIRAWQLIPMNETTLNRQMDYLVATLIDFFRDPSADAKYLDAAKIALNQVARASYVSVDNLERRFTFFASRLRNNITPQSIRFFAKECLESANKDSSVARESKPVDQQRLLRKRAYKEIEGEMALGYSENSAANRVAFKLLREKKRLESQEKRAKLAETHPLKDTLSALNSCDKRMAKEDIRNHLLNLKRKGSTDGKLFGLLAKAQAFSAPKMHALLGDELFFLCKPLGFIDKSDQTLLVEVPTSAHLHALTYRKLEVLLALRKDETFRHAKNIRFKVAYNSF